MGVLNNRINSSRVNQQHMYIARCTYKSYRRENLMGILRITVHIGPIQIRNSKAHNEMKA